MEDKTIYLLNTFKDEVLVDKLQSKICTINYILNLIEEVKPITELSYEKNNLDKAYSLVKAVKELYEGIKNDIEGEE